MSTIKSDDSDITIDASGSGRDIKKNDSSPLESDTYWTRERDKRERNNQRWPQMEGWDNWKSYANGKWEQHHNRQQQQHKQQRSGRTR